MISLDPEKFVERNYSRAGQPLESREGLYIAVHPGFALENDEYKELGLRTEDHFRFTYSFFREFERMADSDYSIAVLEEIETDYSREFLGDYSQEVDHWFETLRGEAKLRYRNADEFIETIDSLEHGAEVIISGELNNLCQGQAWQIIDYVSREKDTDIELRFGESFPSKPLIRDEDGNLRYVEDEKHAVGH